MSTAKRRPHEQESRAGSLQTVVAVLAAGAVGLLLGAMLLLLP
jgi:hypothetical protein